MAAALSEDGFASEEALRCKRQQEEEQAAAQWEEGVELRRTQLTEIMQQLGNEVTQLRTKQRHAESLIELLNAHRRSMASVLRIEPDLHHDYHGGRRGYEEEDDEDWMQPTASPPKPWEPSMEYDNDPSLRDLLHRLQRGHDVKCQIEANLKQHRDHPPCKLLRQFSGENPQLSSFQSHGLHLHQFAETIGGHLLASTLDANTPTNPTEPTEPQKSAAKQHKRPKLLPSSPSEGDDILSLNSGHTCNEENIGKLQRFLKDMTRGDLSNNIPRVLAALQKLVSSYNPDKGNAITQDLKQAYVELFNQQIEGLRVLLEATRKWWRHRVHTLNTFSEGVKQVAGVRMDDFDEDSNVWDIILKRVQDMLEVSKKFNEMLNKITTVNVGSATNAETEDNSSNAPRAVTLGSMHDAFVLNKYIRNLEKSNKREQQEPYSEDETLIIDRIIKLQGAQDERKSQDMIHEIIEFTEQQKTKDEGAAKSAINYIEQLQRESILQSPLMATAQRVFADIHTWHPHLRSEHFTVENMMDATRNSLVTYFQRLVGLDWTLNRRLSGVKVTYASDYKRLTHQYRVTMFIFQEARLVRRKVDTSSDEQTEQTDPLVYLESTDAGMGAMLDSSRAGVQSAFASSPHQLWRLAKKLYDNNSTGQILTKLIDMMQSS